MADQTNSLVAGLFGLTPYQIEQQRNQQAQDYAEKIASMDGFQAAKFGIGQGAAGLTRAIGGMMGMVDPMEQEAQQQQAIMGSGGDMTTAAGLKAKAAQFAAAGDQATALKLIMLARKQEEEQAKIELENAQAQAALHKAKAEASPFAKINPKDYTQESLKEYMLSKNPSDLVAQTPEGKISQIGRELIDAGYVEGSPEFIAEMRKRISAKDEGSRKGAGTTLVMPGNKDMKDIPAFRRDVQLTIKPQLETVYATDKALSALELAINGNPSAFNVARTQLAKAAGDSQISLREIEAAGGDPSIAGTIFNTASTLFTGTPTVELQMNMKRTLQAINKVAKAKARAEISTQKKLAKMSGYTDEQIESALKFDDFDAKPGPRVGEEITLKSGKKVKRVN